MLALLTAGAVLAGCAPDRSVVVAGNLKHTSDDRGSEPGKRAFPSAYTIVNQQTKLALDVPNGAATDGLKVQQWSCNGGAAQAWYLNPAGNGAYTIVNVASGKALDDTNFSTSDGAQVQQWASTGSSNQNWIVKDVTGGPTTIVNQLSGKALDATDGSRANGTIVQQWAPNGNSQQTWTVLSGSCTNRGFNILIDTNQMTLDEANNDAPLAADGIWGVVLNSDSARGVPPYILDPNGVWPSTLARLNAAAWAVTEDYYPDAGNVWTVSGYIGRPVDAAMLYYENPPPYGKANDTILLPNEIDAAAAKTGRSVIVSTRSYLAVNDNRASYVRLALGDPNCSGVDFETSPDYGSISAINLNQGLYDVLRAGRRAYILLPARSNGNYAADIQAGVSQYLAASPQLGNPNVYLVLAVYGRQAGFLPTSSNGANGNNVLSAETWLKSFRQTNFGR